MGRTTKSQPGRRVRESHLSISVVVCTHNRPRELERCLEALSRQICCDFNILVIDNAPLDLTAEKLAANWSAAYRLQPERGLSRARNLGLREASGEVVAFLDDDAVPAPDWLLHLANEFRDPRVMAVTGRITELRNTEANGEDVSEYFSLDSLGEHRLIVDRTHSNWFEIANFGGIGQGSNMAFRRSALRFWPGFDTRLGRGAAIGGSEEHYAFFQLIDHGGRIVYTPRAVVRHPYPANLEAVRHRELRQAADSTAYIAFLLAEVPILRTRLLRYVLEAAWGVRRAWRPVAPHRLPASAARWRRLFAMFGGPLSYFSARFRGELATDTGLPRGAGPVVRPTEASISTLTIQA